MDIMGLGIPNNFIEQVLRKGILIDRCIKWDSLKQKSEKKMKFQLGEIKMKKRIVQTGLMLFILLLYPFSTSRAELKIGESAPEFKATDQEGKIVDLSDFRGKWVVLYFYPKDFTPGCTIEAKRFTELYEDFLKVNALVYGISTDGKERHCDFRDRYKLKVPLIPDQERKITSLYGVKVFLGFASRDTVIIDPSGKIAKIYRKASAIRNPKEALDFIKDSSKGGTIL